MNFGTTCVFACYIDKVDCFYLKSWLYLLDLNIRWGFLHENLDFCHSYPLLGGMNRSINLENWGDGINSPGLQRFWTQDHKNIVYKVDAWHQPLNDFGILDHRKV